MNGSLGQTALAQRSVVGGQIAPAEQGLAFLGDQARDDVLAGAALARVAGQIKHADAVLAGFRQLEAEPPGDLTQKFIGHLDQDAGAVTGVGLGTAGAAMIEVEQDFEPAAHDVVRTAALDVGQKAHTARIVLEGGVVQALFARRLHARIARAPIGGLLVVHQVHSNSRGGLRGARGPRQTRGGDFS